MRIIIEALTLMQVMNLALILSDGLLKGRTNGNFLISITQHQALKHQRCMFRCCNDKTLNETLWCGVMPAGKKYTNQLTRV